MAEAPFVVIEGVDQVVRNLRSLDRRLAAEVQSEIRVMAKTVAERAKEIAEGKGLGPPGTSGRATGALVSHIRTSVRGGSAYITENVRRVSPRYPEGFNYAKVYEYGKRGTAGEGPRAFMHPAARKAEPEIVAAMDRLVARIVAQDVYHA